MHARSVFICRDIDDPSETITSCRGLAKSLIGTLESSSWSSISFTTECTVNNNTNAFVRSKDRTGTEQVA